MIDFLRPRPIDVSDCPFNDAEREIIERLPAPLAKACQDWWFYGIRLASGATFVFQHITLFPHDPEFVQLDSIIDTTWDIADTLSYDRGVHVRIDCIEAAVDYCP